MRENEEDWQKQLNTVIIEIAGLNEIFLQDPQFLQLLSKLEGLKVVDINIHVQGLNLPKEEKKENVNNAGESENK